MNSPLGYSPNRGGPGGRGGIWLRIGALAQNWPSVKDEIWLQTNALIPCPCCSLDPCLAAYLQRILGPLSLQSGSWDKSTWINFGHWLRCLMAIAIEGLGPSWGCWLPGLDNGRPASHINASIPSLSTTQFGNTFEHLQVKRELEDLFYHHSSCLVEQMDSDAVVVEGAGLPIIATPLQYYMTIK